MHASHQHRRSWIVTRAAWLAAGWLSLRPRAQEAPAAKVILTITGNVQKPPGAESIDFDLAMLAKLPQHSFSTKTPWFAQPRKFTGVLLQDLLASVGGKGSMLRAMALNDYRVEIPIEDWTRHGAMVAYLLDDKPMPVRDRGPLFIIYPFHQHANLRNVLYYTRCAWQLKAIEVS